MDVLICYISFKMCCEFHVGSVKDDCLEMFRCKVCLVEDFFLVEDGRLCYISFKMSVWYKMFVVLHVCSILLHVMLHKARFFSSSSACTKQFHVAWDIRYCMSFAVLNIDYRTQKELGWTELRISTKQNRDCNWNIIVLYHNHVVLKHCNSNWSVGILR